MMIKKCLLSACAVTVLATISGGIAKANPALVINSSAGQCTLPDGNGNLVTTNDTKLTSTQSQNGNILVQCKADVTPSSSGQAVQYNASNTGGTCNFLDPIHGLQTTDDFHETVSASGQAILICTVHPN